MRQHRNLYKTVFNFHQALFSLYTMYASSTNADNHSALNHQTLPRHKKTSFSQSKTPTKKNAYVDNTAPPQYLNISSTLPRRNLTRPRQRRLIYSSPLRTGSDKRHIETLRAHAPRRRKGLSSYSRAAPRRRRRKKKGRRKRALTSDAWRARVARCRLSEREPPRIFFPAGLFCILTGDG